MKPSWKSRASQREMIQLVLRTRTTRRQRPWRKTFSTWSDYSLKLKLQVKMMQRLWTTFQGKELELILKCLVRYWNWDIRKGMNWWNKLHFWFKKTKNKENRKNLLKLKVRHLRNQYHLLDKKNLPSWWIISACKDLNLSMKKNMKEIRMAKVHTLINKPFLDWITLKFLWVLTN